MNQTRRWKASRSCVSKGELR